MGTEARPPASPANIVLISDHPLFAQLCKEVIERFSPSFKVTVMMGDAATSGNLETMLAASPALVISTLDHPMNSLATVRATRRTGCRSPIMVICSRYALPTLEELMECGVQSVISSLATPEELTTAVYTLIEGKPEPLMQQYLRAVRSFNHPLPSTDINVREKEILRLVASDLTDREIAAQLRISVRTVESHLRNTYIKLNVKGRTGAVVTALIRGIIRPPNS